MFDAVGTLKKVLNIEITLQRTLPTRIANVDLHISHIRGVRKFDLDGMYLLIVYQTSEPDVIISKQKVVERLPLSMPHSVIESIYIDGHLIMVCSAGNQIARLKSFDTSFDDSTLNIKSLKLIIETIANEIRLLNPATALQREVAPGFQWLKKFTPLPISSAPDAFVINGKLKRNPIAWIDEHNWNQLPVIMPIGYVHGQLHITQIFLTDSPLKIDVRSFDENAPIFLDWATLELSALIRFLSVKSAQSYLEWSELCEALATELVPKVTPTGRIAPQAIDLILPLRKGVNSYITEVAPTLRDWIETAFWMSSTIAALRILSEPTVDDTTRLMATSYAACMFDKAANLLELSKHLSSPFNLSFAQKLPEIEIIQHGSTATPFSNAYALIIGVGATKYEPFSLPVTSNDAISFAKSLTEKAGYLPHHVKVLSDEQATSNGIEGGFSWLTNCAKETPDSTCIVYYSGHGGLVGHEYFLIPHDTDPYNLAHSSISMEQLNTWLMMIRGRRLVIFLDCCHAGSANLSKNIESLFVPKSPDKEINPLQLGEGRVLIASSTETQLSFILAGHSNSLFTEVLLEAFSIKGEVEITTVWAYVREQVSRRALQIGREQTPRLNAANYDKILLCFNN